jgi:hypothetical protein
MSLRETKIARSHHAARFHAKQRKRKHHKQKRRRRSACSPKGLIKNRSGRRTKLRLEQIGAGVFQFRGQDVRQKIEKSIAFWRRLAKSHIEASPATDGTLDRSAAAAALLYRLRTIECSLSVDDLYGAVYNCLLSFTYIHQLTVVDNEPAIVAGQASIEGARDGGILRSKGLRIRNRKMAQEFLERRGGNLRDTALMAKIGAKKELQRRASINAVKSGLADLKRD